MNKKEKVLLFSAFESDIRKHGMECAVMIIALCDRSCEKDRVEKEGDTTWFALATSDFKFIFPYWSDKTSRQILQRLVDKKVIKEKIGRHSRQKFFAFVKKEL